MRRLRFWWHDLRDRHWPELIGDGTFENEGCAGGSRIVVDPDNLPPEAIEKVANVLANIAYNRGWPSEHPNDLLIVAEAAVRAFLSDPEPGDQT